MPKKDKLPPGIHEISRETTPVQEEFISSEATPSRDVHDVPCPRCGKPRADWDGPGVKQGGEVYCCEACAREKKA